MICLALSNHLVILSMMEIFITNAEQIYCGRPRTADQSGMIRPWPVGTTPET